MSDKTDALRAKLLSTKKIRKKKVMLFGEEVELRTGTLRDTLRMSMGDKPQDEMLAELIIRHCYEPDTGEKLFTSEDKDAILEWPFDSETIDFQNQLTEMIGINTEDEKEDLQKSPLGSQSSM